MSSGQKRHKHVFKVHNVLKKIVKKYRSKSTTDIILSNMPLQCFSINFDSKSSEQNIVLEDDHVVINANKYTSI